MILVKHLSKQAKTECLPKLPVAFLPSQSRMTIFYLCAVSQLSIIVSLSWKRKHDWTTEPDFSYV